VTLFALASVLLARLQSETVLILAGLILVVATLYSSVGQGGTSGYLAAMALVGVSPVVMRPTALSLSVLVSAIGTVRFHRAGHLYWPVLWPFLVGSVPLAAIGGALRLPDSLYSQIVGLLLLIAASTLVWRVPDRGGEYRADPPPGVPVVRAVITGAAIGLVSGLTGVGGGLLLSPLLLLTGWAGIRQTAGISVAFILINAMAALSTNLATTGVLPAELPILGVAAVVGGVVGTELGTRRLRGRTMRFILAAILAASGLKLIFP
jgi:uncharacterized membrane protein YfcA